MIPLAFHPENTVFERRGFRFTTGADDVQGTVVREKIFQAAGASAGTEQKVAELVRFVRDAGRTPVQRDSLYNELRRW